MAEVDAAKVFDQAELLGQVYLKMRERRVELGAWGDLKRKSIGVVEPISLALEDLYPAKVNEERWVAKYRTAFFSLRPRLEKASAEAGGRVLGEQMKALNELRRRLRAPGVAAAISDISIKVRERHGGFDPSAEDEVEATRIYGPRYVRSRSVPDGPVEENPRFAGGLQIVFRWSLKAALAAVLQDYRKPSVGAVRHRPGRPVPLDQRAQRIEVAHLCTVLSVHPQFVKIFEAYADSADGGSALADRLVQEAAYATGELFVDLLKTPELAWRYQPFVLLGVNQLGLDDAEGFSGYAVALAEQISERWYRVPLMVLGITIGLVGVLVSGPAAAAGTSGALALVGIGVADFAVTVFAASEAYFRAREQDVAAVSSGFNADKLAEPASYFDTALGAASALLCAIGIVFHGLRASQLLRGARPAPDTVVRRLDRTGKRIVASPSRRGTSRAEEELANRMVNRPQRSRSPEYEPGATRPKHDYTAGGPDDAQGKRLAATGTGGTSPALPRPTPVAPPAAAPSTPGGAPGAAYGSAGTGAVNVMRAPFVHPPGGSTVADTSFPMTAEQRSYSGSSPWRYAEDEVGARLQEETGLHMLTQNSKAARQLGIKGDPDKLPQIGRRILIKEPIITHPGNPSPRYMERYGKLATPEASWKPDYVYLTPERLEVFEATLDNRFRISPQESGMVLRGTAQRFGDAHKEIQLWKAEYLIRRYPNMDLVYNIQTFGQFPEEALGPRIRGALEYLNNVRAEVNGTGSTQIIIRADRPYVYP